MNKKIIFWGAGFIGKQALNTLEINNNFEIIFGDNDHKKIGALYCEKRVMGITEILDMYQKGIIDTIILTTECWTDVFLQCINYGISAEVIRIFDANKSRVCTVSDMYGNYVFSQDGEELFLRERFQEKTAGFYVDIGAHHPYRFSNTWWAYQRGWRGINIEPCLENFRWLEVLRTKDININCGISDEEREIEYYELEESALNTFSRKEAEKSGEIINIRKVPVYKMSTILKKYGKSEIDFMNIDVEGMEMQVLSSVEWNEVDIKYILLEQKGLSLSEVLNSQEYIFLFNRGYEAVSKFNRTVIYERKY